MSRKYKTGEHVPSHILAKRLDELADAVTKGKAAIDREFVMRIPAELDHDPDLVLSQAAKRIRDLEAQLEDARKRLTCAGGIYGCTGGETCTSDHK
jgi:predicted DNA-binding protein